MGISPLIDYHMTGALPQDDRLARKIVLSGSRYTLLDQVLYHIEDDSTLRVVPPQTSRRRLFVELHSGKFGSHLSGEKVFSELRKHYWWEGMRSDVNRWARSCLICASHGLGRKTRPPLSPIPVAGAFDRIGVDVLQLPKTRRGNKYAIVFVEYLTKWPEVYPAPDQTSATIAKLLVEEVIARHGVPSEILSDRGKAFLSSLMQEVELLLGYKKLNMTAYHPQTDGLVERFNRTLIAMLAKTTCKEGPEWDEHLPYVLFAYRASQQTSTQESPFYLLYDRDPRLPVPAALSPRRERLTMDLKEYGIDLHSKLSSAWELARKSLQQAQKKQKTQYDRKVCARPFREGERAFLYKPAEKTGEFRKLTHPFDGPYRVLEVGTNTASIVRIDRPKDEPILVSLDRLRHCPTELGDEFWPPDKRRRKRGQRHAENRDWSPASLGEADETEVATGSGPQTEGVNPPIGPDGEEVEITEAELNGEDSLLISHSRDELSEQTQLDERGQIASKWAGRLRPRNRSQIGRLTTTVLVQEQRDVPEETEDQREQTHETRMPHTQQGEM